MLEIVIVVFNAQKVCVGYEFDPVFVSLCFCQFPSVTHPQTLERRYQGILSGLMLDLMKVKCQETFQLSHKNKNY